LKKWLSVFDHTEGYIKPEQIGTFQKLRRAPQNFFKHADKDPEETFESYPTAAGQVLDLIKAVPGGRATDES
jgi:hypothetical protein